MDFNSDNPYFYCIPPKNILDKFTIIRDICRFLQPGFISSRSFEEKLNLPTANHNRIYKAIVELIPKDWILLLKNKTQESLLKVFYFNNRGTKKVKNLQKLSNKDIYFTLQNDNEDYNRPFKFISWQNLIQGNCVLSPEIGAKFSQIGSNVQLDMFSPSGINSFISPYLRS